ncbi:hypothetical protein SteCoe_2275 [Stentor coeruleus]|uniref:PX domain-containing protein n=1 Tax=Stentor coeruleus TaxID=5963 RepID=A0A1R2CZU5_9CILI|nr:hypothetical protein SteCoe_2275 [Stentor coeruleus]
MEEEFSSTTETLYLSSKEPLEKSEEIVTVTVDSYKLEEGRMKKHAVYKIFGQDSSGTFECNRRYKEFQMLRSYFAMMWPGCYIPKLPKKKVVGNLDTDLIHKRKKLLDYFVGRVVSYGFLYKSEPFQLFIRGPADYIKGTVNLKSPSFVELQEKYKETFPEVGDFEMNQKFDDDMTNFYNTLEDCLRRVKSFKKSCKKSVLSFYRYEDSLTRLSGGVNQITHYFFPTRENTVDFIKKATNAYKILLDWARRELLEIESLMDTIEKKLYLEQILVKCQTRLGVYQKGLENFQSGKKSLMQRLSKKTDEQKLKHLEGHVADSEKELVALQEVIRIATGRLIHYQIPRFKEKEAEKLECTIRSYSGLIVEEFNDFITHFTSLQETITPTVI